MLCHRQYGGDGHNHLYAITPSQEMSVGNACAFGFASIHSTPKQSVGVPSLAQSVTTMDKMRAVVLTGFGTPKSALEFQPSHDRPTRKKGEVLVLVHATSVNSGGEQLLCRGRSTGTHVRHSLRDSLLLRDRAPPGPPPTPSHKRTH